jgi:uncharacterized LabA/DUF88 family protein
MPTNIRRFVSGVQNGNVGFNQIRNQAAASKAFYYDCLNDIQRQGETQRDYEARLTKQESFFDHIRSYDGYHVRLGSVSGQKRIRQKQVDVLLAVDMLSHAFHRNMERAVLVAGDLDFRPIIDAVIHHGIYVQVWYDPMHAARDLYLEADAAREMHVSGWYGWSTEEFQKAHPVPTARLGGPLPGCSRHRNGRVNGQLVELYECGQDWMIYAPSWNSTQDLCVTFPRDLPFLEKYFSMMYGRIEWT